MADEHDDDVQMYTRYFFFFARVHFVAYFNHVIYTHVGGVIDIIIVNKQANKQTCTHTHTHEKKSLYQYLI